MRLPARASGALGAAAMIAPLFRACMLVACLLPAFGARAAAAQDVSVGKRFVLHSRILGEDREVLVHLPPRYDIARKRYPVLFVLDGNHHFAYASSMVDYNAFNQRMPEAIVVAVPNMQKRARDLTMPLQNPPVEKEKMADYVPAGGSKAFLGFLADELAPWIDAHYRTAPYSILSGHSLGGLFNFYALLERPEAFQAHIAVSPSLWWDQRAWVKAAIARLPQLPGQHALYFSWSDDEESIRDSSQELVDWMRQQTLPQLRWTSRYYPGDNHGTTPLRTLYDGLEWLYAGWDFEPRQAETLSDEALTQAYQAHAAELSQRLGYRVDAEPSLGMALARRMVERKQWPQALDKADSLIKDFPETGSLYSVRAQALEELGRPREALAAYRTSLAYPGAYGNAWEQEHRLRELKDKAAGK